MVPDTDRSCPKFGHTGPTSGRSQPPAVDSRGFESIRGLCVAAESGDVTDDVAGVRAADSRCDDLRTDVIAAAFRDGAIADSAAYRALAIRFDRVVGAAEAVTTGCVP